MVHKHDHLKICKYFKLLESKKRQKGKKKLKKKKRKVQKENLKRKKLGGNRSQIQNTESTDGEYVNPL